jgi:glycosyltransferase involved in cell wall biosynthesis
MVADIHAPLTRILRSARGLARRLRDLGRVARGGTAGGYRYVFDPSPPPTPPLVELRLPAEVGPDAAAAWCARQTLPELRAIGYHPDGTEAWRLPPTGVADESEAPWFAAPGELAELLPVHLESALLVAAAESVDAVVLRERVTPALDPTPRSAGDLDDPRLRPYALYRSDSYRWHPGTGAVHPTGRRSLVKLIDSGGVGVEPSSSETFSSSRRGPYLATERLPSLLEVGVRDAALLNRSRLGGDRPTVLVLAPFLARGGAEHTLFETLNVLTDRFRFAIVTLAPHRPALGDRREDFRSISERLYCLGDLVHPAAMYGMLVALIDSLAVDIVYNANGTTLFYDFAPRLKQDRPEIRIIDHLYDHRVGYIERYTPQLLDSVDACVAENHRIAEVLTRDRGWPAERVPVIWPCGRPSSAFAPPEQRAALRAAIREELGYETDDVIFLTAARMHPQKRPLDLVALSSLVQELDKVHFLIVGGGDLSDEVDEAIAAAAAARIRRLPFRTDIPDLIVAADVGCLVSDFEGLPVFLLECLQAGLPFLGTDVGDLGPVLRSTGAGVVVDTPGDLEALEDGVRRLAQDAERRRLAGRAAAAAEQFGVEACAAAYAAAFVGSDEV